jgi:hypothetical protein
MPIDEGMSLAPGIDIAFCGFAALLNGLQLTRLLEVAGSFDEAKEFRPRSGHA